MKMESMLIITGNVFADFRMVGNDIEIIRIYRKNAIGTRVEYTYNDPVMVDLAKSTIRAVKAGWMRIKP
jgi:hypothetical protein